MLFKVVAHSTFILPFAASSDTLSACSTKVMVSAYINRTQNGYAPFSTGNLPLSVSLELSRDHRDKSKGSLHGYLVHLLIAVRLLENMFCMIRLHPINNKTRKGYL